MANTCVPDKAIVGHKNISWGREESHSHGKGFEGTEAVGEEADGCFSFKPPQFVLTRWVVSLKESK